MDWIKLKINQGRRIECFQRRLSARARVFGALINIYLYIRSPSALLDNFYVVSHHTDAASANLFVIMKTLQASWSWLIL